MKRTSQKKPLSAQVKKRAAGGTSPRKQYDGNPQQMISTGSTLLDLAISGGRVHGGGIPAGILVEIFGPSGAGKTVMLSEIAGAVQRLGGDIMFRDPEARLNKQFASMFDLDTDDMDYTTPNTIPEVFTAVRNWEPEGNAIHGIFTDSLTALSTDLEMSTEEGDKMGARRAKEFSEELRRTCRVLTANNYLMVCSNQIRENINVTYGPRYKSPGGQAIGFYSSLRLKIDMKQKIINTAKVAGKEIKKVIGVRSEVEVFKSSVWEPYHTAPVTILFDYGIDDIRENLQYIKDHSKNTVYTVNDRSLDKSMIKSIRIVEDEKLEGELKDQVIEMWEYIETKLKVERKKKQR